MSDRSTMFRPEAMEYRAQMQGPGGLLQLRPGWSSWAFWVLVGLVLAGLIAASTVHVTRYATGATGADGHGRLVVFVPASLASQVVPGSSVDLGGSTTQVLTTAQNVLSPEQVRKFYGVAVSEPSRTVLTSADPSEGTGTARVQVESGPMIVELVPGLKALLGDDDG